MSKYDDRNKFVLFPNKQKRDAKDRDYSGSINIDGKEYWLNGYNRANGVVGGGVKPKEDPQKVVQETRARHPRETGDDIPW